MKTTVTAKWQNCEMLNWQKGGGKTGGGADCINEGKTLWAVEKRKFCGAGVLSKLLV